MSRSIQLSALTIYPVKSLAGIALQHARLDAMGLAFDRRWMLVDAEGQFLSQRSHPHMALIQPQLDEAGQLTLNRAGREAHKVPSANLSAERMQVKVWNDEVEAVPVSTLSDAWLSETIGTACHLVFISDDEVRQCDLVYAQEGDRTGFSDGFPLLLISEASLEDLNNRLETPLPMQRFRPNLVVSGCDAYAEDSWSRIDMGGIPLRVVKPCSRCVITTVDPQTGVKSGTEPLKTLATYRQRDNKVYFGQNVIQDATGELRVGMPVTLR